MQHTHTGDTATRIGSGSGTESTHQCSSAASETRRDLHTRAVTDTSGPALWFEPAATFAFEHSDPFAFPSLPPHHMQQIQQPRRACSSPPLRYSDRLSAQLSGVKRSSYAMLEHPVETSTATATSGLGVGLSTDLLSSVSPASLLYQLLSLPAWWHSSDYLSLILASPVTVDLLTRLWYGGAEYELRINDWGPTFIDRARAEAISAVQSGTNVELLIYWISVIKKRMDAVNAPATTGHVDRLDTGVGSRSSSADASATTATSNTTVIGSEPGASFGASSALPVPPLSHSEMHAPVPSTLLPPRPRSTAPRLNHAAANYSLMLNPITAIDRLSATMPFPLSMSPMQQFAFAMPTVTESKGDQCRYDSSQDSSVSHGGNFGHEDTYRGSDSDTSPCSSVGKSASDYEPREHRASVHSAPDELLQSAAASLFPLAMLNQFASTLPLPLPPLHSMSLPLGMNGALNDALMGNIQPSTRRRRRSEELAESERWRCPNPGCWRFYRRSSTTSIRTHQQSCRHMPLHSEQVTHPVVRTHVIPNLTTCTGTGTEELMIFQSS